MAKSVARPTSHGGNVRTHRAGSKSVTSHPREWANPSVSNAVMGRAPLRPARNASSNATAPVPILDTTPTPVTATLRISPAQRGTQHRENTLDVHQPFELVLIDLDIELDLEVGEQFDQLHRVRAEGFNEQVGVLDLVRVHLQHLAHETSDVLRTFGHNGMQCGTHCIQLLFEKSSSSKTSSRRRRAGRGGGGGGFGASGSGSRGATDRENLRVWVGCCAAGCSGAVGGAVDTGGGTDDEGTGYPGNGSFCRESSSSGPKPMTLSLFANALPVAQPPAAFCLRFSSDRCWVARSATLPCMSSRSLAASLSCAALRSRNARRSFISRVICPNREITAAARPSAMLTPQNVRFVI